MEEKCSILESELENIQMKNLNKTKNDSIDQNNSAENEILDDLIEKNSTKLKKRTFEDKLAFPMRLNFKSELVQKVSSFPFCYFFSQPDHTDRNLSIILDKVTITKYQGKQYCWIVAFTQANKVS